MENKKIAIVGASGLVGQTILKVLYEENMFDCEIKLFVSKRSAGKEFIFCNRKFKYIELDESALNEKYDIVFFSAGGEVSLKWAKRFAENGAIVIDNTNAFRRELGVPLIVPEINFDTIKKDTKLISNPNCSTIELAVVLDKLLGLGEIEKVVVSTYQAVSGAGRLALLDLQKNAKNVFKCGINDEIIAKIGEIQENGYSLEENKIMFELSKILNVPLNVSATAVRVPTSICHGESVYVKFKNKVSVSQARMIVGCEYIKVTDEIVPLKRVKNTNLTFVCRLRQLQETELEFFVIADNLRRGAGYNAVKIAKKILKK